MRLSKTEKANINYLAKIVQINNFSDHPDPEVTKLKCCSVDGFNIICGIQSEPGLYVYFPASCCLNPNLLSFANLYKHSHMNANPEESGMFEDNGRVKAIRLRGCVSEGFILPVVILENFVMSATNKELEYSVNDEFDCVKEGDKEFWINKKYVASHHVSNPVSCNENKKGTKGKKKLSKVIDDQFRFHYDTVIIKKCPNVIHPEDYIHISSKVHGTSGISAYVLCNRELDWKDKIIKFINDKILRDFPIDFTDYDYLYSSRTVVKNKYYNEKAGYYEIDVWNEADKIIRPHLVKGMTAYYEIIGYLPNGGYIQKNYDYGYEIPKEGEGYTYGKHFGIRVYRLTLTNYDGVVHEFSPREVQTWCQNKGLIPVTEYYYGKAGDLYPSISGCSNWADEFLNQLSNEAKFNMEKDSPECKNKVPHEGIVIKIDNMKSAAFKLKCFKFLNKEQKELDSGEINIEDEA